MLVNIKVTGGLNIESGHIDPKATGGWNIESGQIDPKATGKKMQKKKNAESPLNQKTSSLDSFEMSPPPLILAHYFVVTMATTDKTNCPFPWWHTIHPVLLTSPPVSHSGSLCMCVFVLVSECVCVCIYFKMSSTRLMWFLLHFDWNRQYFHNNYIS